ncbi:7012_t:CDS:2 [Diversispora eburnea]|uniref:7012_t:CDS:1 n=1 Tax=Diversispora eburnea TaxID=1213867 RepID=A0A9N8YMM8_9GLOM|nr:7012_t:CDS:2 [Diversispora eburnea]
MSKPLISAVLALWRDIAIEGLDDLWKVANSEADFDATRKGKAKEVLDNWKLNLNSDELFVRRLSASWDHISLVMNSLFDASASWDSLSNKDELLLTIYVSQDMVSTNQNCESIKIRNLNKHHRDVDNEEQLISNEFSIQPKKVKLDNPILDAVESSSSNNYNNSEQEVIPSLTLKRFEEEYLKMISDHMWTLKSGRKVEVIIYEFARKLTCESYLHSFIINESDMRTRSLFSEDEWKEITTSEAKDRRELENSLKELLKKYIVNNIERELIRDECLEPPYRSIFYNLNIDLIHSEGMTGKIENVMGFRLHEDSLEFGAIEAGRKWESGTKFVEMLQSSNRMQVITADLPKRYVVRVQRGKVCEVAGCLTKSKPLALVLKEIFYVKYTILQTLDIVNHKDDVNVENFLDDSKDGKN